MNFNFGEYNDGSSLGCLGEYHAPWVDESLYSAHRKSSIV